MSSPTTPAGTESQPRYATFPRRLNALSTDALILIAFSAFILALLPSGEERPALRLSLGFLWLGALILYEPIMVTWFGGTVGHRLMNLKVVDDHTGGNPGLMKSILRYFIKGILGVISFFSMSFARRHRALHDMMTRSTVQIRDPGKAAPHHYVVGRDPPPPP